MPYTAGMVEFQDLKLDRPDRDPEFDLPPQRRFPLWIAMATAALLLGGALAYFTFFGRGPAPATVQTQTEQAVKPPPSRGPAEPGENIPLPPLDESDALVRQLVATLSSHPMVAAWLTTDDLVRNFTVVVANIADGQTPAVHLRKVRPAGTFLTRETAGRTFIDPRSYQRYDPHAAAVEAIDARGSARLYATLKPRIEDAYRDLDSGDFDAVLERAIVHLLRTPVVEGAQIESDSVMYTYLNPSLESLSKAQRQLLRTGPRNQRLVQAKLREIAQYLGIPVESLPPETRQG
jgi:hypothetical protein